MMHQEAPTAVDGPVEFRDSQSQRWKVFEVVRGEIGGLSKLLVFESSICFRCVRTYPREWRDLDAQRLEELSWRT
jgi:hypothetical protein